MLFRYQPNPGCKIPTPTKDLHGRGESKDSHGRDWADAWHGLETACGIVFCRFGTHLFLKLADLISMRSNSVNVDRPNVCDYLWQTILRIFQNVLQAFDISRSLRCDLTKLGEMSPQGIDYLRALSQEQVTCPEQNRPTLLVMGFHSDCSHRRT